MVNWKNVTIPPALAQRPKDARGIPIPFVTLIDKVGRPHFTINDLEKVHKVLKEDRCGLCGLYNYRWRWFAGGPLSAFNPRGAYYADPPMHWDCLHYALQVCPYLALRNYHEIPSEATAARIDPSTMINNEIVTSGISKKRPDVIVIVKATGTRIVHSGKNISAPLGKYISIDYWQWGKHLSNEEGRALVPPEFNPDIFLK